MSGNFASGQSFTEITEEPSGLVVSVAEAKAWLRVNGSTDDAIIESLIESATDLAEAFTKRTLRVTEFKTYRDVFGDISDNALFHSFPAQNYFSSQNDMPITIRKCPLVSVESIQYYIDGVLTTFTDFYVVKKPDFSRLAPNTYWPIVDRKMQAIQISFTAGYDEVPSALKTAILNHVLYMYENRGDCGCDGKIPAVSQTVYNRYRIMDFVA